MVDLIQRRALWIVAVLAACNHGEPFRPGEYGPDGPFASGPLIRLTLNPGTDFAPVWVSNTGIVYTAERLDRVDHDRCLAFLPAGGGAITGYVCAVTSSDDSTQVLEEAAPGSAGRLVYVRMTTHRLPARPLTPDAQALVLSTLSDPNTVRVLRTIPYTPPWGGTPHLGVGYVSWRDSTKLVYLAQSVSYPRDCGSCPPDTVRTGMEIVTLDLAPAAPVLSQVPGTDNASSVTVGASGDTIYFTRNGDGRLYRHVFSSGAADTIYDFGPDIARDASYRAGRVVVVVGGPVVYDSSRQEDGGGDLQVVDVATRTATPLPRTIGGRQVFYRRPVFSPNGQELVAEGVEFVVDSTFIFPNLFIDTTYLTGNDLWQRAVP